MGWSFRKRVTLLPGVRINFGKSGTSWSLGPRGSSVSVGKRGIFLNSSIPGTGLYRRDKIANNDSNGCFSTLVGCLYAVIWCGLIALTGLVAYKAYKSDWERNEIVILVCVILLDVCVYFVPRLIEYLIERHREKQAEVIGDEKPEKTDKQKTNKPKPPKQPIVQPTVEKPRAKTDPKPVIIPKEETPLERLQRKLGPVFIKMALGVVETQICTKKYLSARYHLSQSDMNLYLDWMEQCGIIALQPNGRYTILITRQEEAMTRLESLVSSENHLQLSLNNLDPLFSDVAHFVVAKQEASVSRVQSAFEIGYNRAGKLFEQLELAEIVSADRGSVGRAVLIPDLDELENHLSKFQ